MTRLLYVGRHLAPLASSWICCTLPRGGSPLCGTTRWAWMAVARLLEAGRTTHRPVAACGSHRSDRVALVPPGQLPDQAAVALAETCPTWGSGRSRKTSSFSIRTKLMSTDTRGRRKPRRMSPWCHPVAGVRRSVPPSEGRRMQLSSSEQDVGVGQGLVGEAAALCVNRALLVSWSPRYSRGAKHL